MSDDEMDSTGRTGNQRFTKAEHLRRRRDFDRLFAKRCSVADDVLVVYVATNALPYSRLGISVSKRLGNAVSRNHVRRRIREAFRSLKGDLPTGYDILCVARPQATRRSSDVAKSLAALIPRVVDRLTGKSRGNSPR